MLLKDYPVPGDNTKWGIHLWPLECQDMSGRDYQWHYESIKRVSNMGASWLSIISSPGGSDGYTQGKSGCSELTFEIANELGLMPIVRIFNSGIPPYYTDAVKKLCTRLLKISNNKPFYLKLNNEIDQEWKTAANREMTLEDARWCCRSVGESIDAVWNDFNGLVIPSFLNIGYGGSGYNFFEIMHEIGMGDRLDRCFLPVHPYTGAWPPNWVWSETLLKPILLTQEEYDSYDDYAWSKGTGALQTLDFVNQKRIEAHEQRAQLYSTQDLIDAYAYGFFTYKWALYMLDQLGHTETPLLFPEWGTRVGETVPGLPAISPKRHMDYTLAMIEEMKQEPRILGGGMWMLDAVGTSQNWFDQALYSPVWDIANHENMPESWQDEIKTWGQLPLVDYLLENPVTAEEGVAQMSNKLGMHIQIGSDDLLPILSEIQAPVNKTMDLNRDWCASMKAASPDSLLVGRAFVDNQNRYMTDMQGLTEEMLNKYAPAIDSLDAIEVPNEVVNNNVTQEEKAAWDRFQVFFCESAWERWPNIKVILFNIPTGNGGIQGELTLEEFPLSMSLPVNKIMVGIHEYGWPLMNDGQGWYALRYRKIMKSYPNHKVIITECGVTNAIVQGEPDVGWRTHGNRDDYINSLVWYNSELNKDNYVVGCCVFNVGASFGWDSFESLLELQEAVQMMPINLPPEPPAIIEPIRVKVGDEILVIELEEYLCEVLPAELPPLWPTEVLRAGAIAARTFARWRIDNPRSEEFDLYGDSRDQNYRPDLLHENTSLAVYDTRGITWPGTIGQYVSRCGLNFCPVCEGENGYDNKQWPGRMCQEGARVLAEQGKTAEEILSFYYDKQEPIQEGDCNKLVIDNDAEEYNVLVLSEPVDGDTYFKVVKVHHLLSEENGSWPGNHHLYLDVLDRDGNRINGAQLEVKWGESDVEKITTIIDKPANEPGANIPLYKYQVVSVEMKNYASDMAYNIHTDHPDEGGSNNIFHHSFLVVFQECIAGDISPEPEPPVDQIDEWRNILWNEKGIDYYPDAAITKFARAQGLGAPETNEIEDSGNIIQGFVNGWCHVIKGDWQNIHVEEW